MQAGGDFKLIGAGWGRTGTLSLKIALEHLGFGPCYHMKAVIEASDGLDHVGAWDRAFDTGELDLRVLKPFQSGLDLPMSNFWRELMEAYPEAKVILTVRDPDPWFKSLRMILEFNHRTEWLQFFSPWMARFHGMIGKVLVNMFPGGRDAAEADPEMAKAAFLKHNAEVIATVPPERLLVFNVKQGWEPLCQFLGVPVPESPFPHANSASDMRNLLNKITFGVLVTSPQALAVYAGIAAWIGYRARHVFSR
jgi:hypothetical protein